MDVLEAEIAQIAFFLAKPGTEFDTILDEGKDILSRENAKKFSFTVEDVDCVFFYFESRSSRKNPPWLDFMNENLGEDHAITFSAQSQAPNGLLFLKIEGRVLAATFGRSSAGFLEKGNLEPDFGIITAMNMCGNEEIRQTKSQSHAITPTQIDRQVGKPSDSFVFGLSEAEDLKYISAHLKGESSVTLQGRDNLTIKVAKKKRLNWEALVERCREFLGAYEKRDFIELFPNYKNFKAADDEQIEKLESILLESIQAESFDTIQLGVPEFISEEEFSFSYSNHRVRSNAVFSFLDPKQLVTRFPKMNELTIEKLKNNFIYAYSHAEDRILPYRRWRLFHCIVFETALNGKYFVLSDGRWLEVDSDFHKSVVDFTKDNIVEVDCPDDIKDIDISDLTKKQNREEVFNEAVCKLRPDAILFDQAKLRIGEGPKNKEFCDILDCFGDGLVSIIHCKPYKDSSSTVYLFSQAQMYCEAFLSDQVFLDDIRDHIDASGSPKKEFYLEYVKPELADINGRDYSVCLWLLYDRLQPKPIKEKMPLMAQYELKLLSERLRHAFKYRNVWLSFIPVHKVNFRTDKAPGA